MKFLKAVIIVGFASTVWAKTEVINMNPKAVSVQSKQGFGTFANSVFAEVNVKGFQNTRLLGRPSLPVKTWLLAAKPADITVNVDVRSTQVLKNVVPYPVQQQECRCATDRKITFTMDAKSYLSNRDDKYTLTYLGMYKGQPITQLSVKLAHYDATTKEVVLDTGVTVTHNATEFALIREDLKNYLIIAPQALVAGLNDFIDWKKSQGYNIVVETLASPNTTLAAVGNLVKDYYNKKQADFVMIIGDEATVPMFKVSTSGGTTPSDLQYFLMDGAGDTIPDVYSSRIVATTPADVQNKLAKAIEFEKRSYIDKKGFNVNIGIASNEGFNPSDDEYVKSVEGYFESRMNFKSVHFYQNDKNSNPTELNKALTSGAVWLTYLGHGSGTSWPSMNQQYNMSEFKKIKNKLTVKPIVIDVACQNGRLTANRLGTEFINVVGLTDNDAFGAAAYYGGSVDISWHPPAVMARGIAMEHSSKNFHHLGQALLAGQMQLAAEWNNPDQVMDNFEWYHLQGDPGMNIQF